MARSTKNARSIVVKNVSYRWRASGNDGYISVAIWPSNDVGPSIFCNFQYHETWIQAGEGRFHSAGDQIVITNRLIRQVIEFAVSNNGYNPGERGNALNLRRTDNIIDLSDAVRARNNALQNDNES